jgi:hypothetical protein
MCNLTPRNDFEINRLFLMLKLLMRVANGHTKFRLAEPTVA